MLVIVNIEVGMEDVVMNEKFCVVVQCGFSVNLITAFILTR